MSKTRLSAELRKWTHARPPARAPYGQLVRSRPRTACARADLKAALKLRPAEPSVVRPLDDLLRRHAALASQDRRRIVEHAAGNPGFALNLLQSWADAGALEFRGAEWSVSGRSLTSAPCG